MAYNPQIEYRGDRYLFAGIAGAGNAVAGGIDEVKRRKREFDGLLTYGDATGIVPKDLGSTMSLEELKSVIGASEYNRIQARQDDTSRRQNALADAQIGNIEADNARADSATAEQQRSLSALLGFNADLAQRVADSEASGPAGPADNVGRPVRVSDLLGIAAQREVTLSPQDVGSLSKALGISRDPESEKFDPRVVTKTDENGKSVRFAVTGPKQAQVLPGEELTKAQAAQYAKSLQAQRRSLIMLSEDPTKSTTPESRARLEQEIQDIDAELSDLGFGRKQSDSASQPKPTAADPKNPLGLPLRKK